MTKSKARMVILSERMLSRASSIEKNDYLIKCRQCNCNFHVGDEIVTKKNKNRTRWYHKKCAEFLNIWWDDSK